MKTTAFVGLVFFCLSSASLIAESQTSLSSFTTDSCTLFPNGTLTRPSLWRHCCITHDFDYWIGGSEEVRRVANVWLGVCINESRGAPVDAPFGMLASLGTNLGGRAHLPDGWRWNYGWPRQARISRRSLSHDLPEVLAKLDEARAWLETSSFRQKYGLSLTQQKFILRGVDFKRAHPFNTSFEGTSDP